MPSANEELLRGPGAGGGVIRCGATVHRSAERTSTGMLAVLGHLEEVAFEGAPRYRGRDERGRHVVDYIEGQVALPPLPGWVASDALLESVARLLRRYHDAVEGVDWAARELEWGYPPPRSYQGRVPCHLDVSPANVVCRSGSAVALIDFEETAPARPVWDVARTVRYWVPMLAPQDLSGAWSTVRGRQAERLALFADAYRLAPDGRSELVDAMMANADASYHRMRTEAAAGHPHYTREWLTGPAERNRRGRDWMTAARAALTASLR